MQGSVQGQSPLGDAGDLSYASICRGQAREQAGSSGVENEPVYLAWNPALAKFKCVQKTVNGDSRDLHLRGGEKLFPKGCREHPECLEKTLRRGVR